MSAAAPYRHFADRDELLVAVAVRALQAFAGALTTGSSDSDSPEDRLAAMAAAYVRFAAGRPALFGLVFGLGSEEKERYPELRRAYAAVDARLAAGRRRAMWGRSGRGGGARRRRRGHGPRICGAAHGRAGQARACGRRAGRVTGREGRPRADPGPRRPRDVGLRAPP